MSQYIARLGGAPRRALRACDCTAGPAAWPCSPCTPPRSIQPGTGDAGGMNVYIVELAQRLAAINIEVEIFTLRDRRRPPAHRRTRPRRPRPARRRGPYEGLARRSSRPSCAPSPTA
ncbi:hypothetical protein GCM10023238_24140 [Streptomyces heliomycini]